MSSQALYQRFMVIRGGCWQCLPDCRSRLAEVLTFSKVAYNVELCGAWWASALDKCRIACVVRRLFIL